MTEVFCVSFWFKQIEHDTFGIYTTINFTYLLNFTYVCWTFHKENKTLLIATHIDQICNRMSRSRRLLSWFINKKAERTSFFATNGANNVIIISPRFALTTHFQAAQDRINLGSDKHVKVTLLLSDAGDSSFTFLKARKN